MKKTIEIKQCDYCDKESIDDSIQNCIVCGKDICPYHKKDMYIGTDFTKNDHTFYSCENHPQIEFLHKIGEQLIKITLKKQE